MSGPDAFTQLLARANVFFDELAQNNNKPWFEERKAIYVAEIRKPAELMADLVAEDLSRLTGRSFNPKLFRIYRDVRFSKDKTLYNAHLHMSFRAAGAPPWFFGSAPDYCVLCTGVPGLKGPQLTAWRDHVDRQGKALVDTIAEAQDSGARPSQWGEAALKRVPKPYPPDHPFGDLLRRKSLVLEVTPDMTHGALSGLTRATGTLMPLWRLLDDWSLCDD